MVITMEDLRSGRVDFSGIIDEDAEPLLPTHPGEHVRDWLEQTGVTAYALAKAMKVPQTRIAEILAGRRGITVDTAVRLGRAIGTSAEMWIGLQTSYELELARRNHVGEDVERIAA
jgi:antitoxin HigA-1